MRLIQRCSAARRSTRLLLLLVSGMFAAGVIAGGGESAAATPSISQVASVSPTTPAATAPKSFDGSPRSYAAVVKSTQSTTDACQYLTYCRWKSANAMPLPDVGMTKMTQLPAAIAGGLAQFVFAIAALGMFVVGMALGFAMSIDLLSKAVYTADYLYSVTATNLLGMNGGSGSYALAVVLFGLLVAVGAKILIPGISRYGFNLGSKSLLVAFVGIIVAGGMAVQATNNHEGQGGSNPAPIAAMASGSGARISDGPQDAVGTPSNWSPFSPGWVVSNAYVVANQFGGVVSQATTGVSNAIANGYNSRGDNACDRYVAALHVSYLNTPAAKSLAGKSSVLLSYDNLMQSLYFRNYRLAAFGNSSGAANSWCRMVENQAQTPAGEQMMVSRVAGLYREALGTGGLGLTGAAGSVVDPNNPDPGSGIAIGTSGGTFLNPDGSWTKDANQSARAAAQYIGPNLRNSDAGTQAAMYWAACEWKAPGAWATLNPEWAGVLRADSKDPLKVPADYHGVEGKNDCTSKVLANNVDDGFGADGSHQKRWNYKEDDGWTLVGPLFGWGSSSAVEKFSPAAKGDGNPALGYYLTMQGSNAATELILAIVAAALIWLTIRYFGPIVLGAMFSQALAVAFLVMAALLIILLIIPMQQTRRVFMTVIKVVCAALIVASLLAVLFAFTFALTTLFTALLSSSSADPLVQAILAGIGAVMGFWVVRTMIHSFTGLNVGTVSGGIQAGLAAGSPALQSLGFDVVSPLSRDFWSWRRQHPTTEDRTLTDDATTPVSNDSTQVDDRRDLLTDASTKKEADGSNVGQHRGQAGSRLDRLSDHADRLAKTNVPYAGAASKVLDGARRVRDMKEDPATAIGTTKAAKDEALTQARKILSGDVGQRERGIYTKRQLSNPRTPHRADDMVRSLTPVEPRMTTNDLAKAGVVVPSKENIARYAPVIPGLASQQTRARTPRETEAMFYDLTGLAAEATVQGTAARMDPFRRGAAIYWAATQPAEMLDNNAVPTRDLAAEIGKTMPSSASPIGPEMPDDSRPYDLDDLIRWAAQSRFPSDHFEGQDLDSHPEDVAPPEQAADVAQPTSAPGLDLADETRMDRIYRKIDKHRDLIIHTLSNESEDRPTYVPEALWNRWTTARNDLSDNAVDQRGVDQALDIQRHERAARLAAQISDLFGQHDPDLVVGNRSAQREGGQSVPSPEERQRRATDVFNQLLRDASAMQRRRRGENPSS